MSYCLIISLYGPLVLSLGDMGQMILVAMILSNFSVNEHITSFSIQNQSKYILSQFLTPIVPDYTSEWPIMVRSFDPMKNPTFKLLWSNDLIDFRVK